jgi:hypothetical protein
VTRSLSQWRVHVEAHELLAGRWAIAEQVLQVDAVNDIEARVLATRQLHVAAGVRPSHVLLRRTYVRTSATPTATPARSARR